MKNSKKGGRKYRHFFKTIINVILISFISICLWEMLQKQIEYNKNNECYDQIQQEKHETKNINKLLSDKNCDWITINDTAIDYPLMTYTDNDYYMTHNYKGENDIGGAIFYDCYDEPHNGTFTIIYGHSMRNGTMFNNLHFFQKDKQKFNNSTLEITTIDNKKEYEPLAYYVTSDDFYYRNLDNTSTVEAINIIKEKSDYFIEKSNIKENAHIIALYTCDYSIKNGRLIVFYIEK
jgi:sortase B